MTWYIFHQRYDSNSINISILVQNPVMSVLFKWSLLSLFTFVGWEVRAQVFGLFQDSAQIQHTFKQVNFNGGGVAFVDIDNDHDDDIYLVGGSEMDRIFINNGQGIFDDMTSGSGIEVSANYYTTGAIYGDVNGDGYQDIFVSTINKGDTLTNFASNLLFINNGDYTFTEVWDQGSDRDKAMSLGACMFDYDLDGDLDIYSINYVENIRFTYDDDGNINGFDHDCFANRLYRNDGHAVFAEVSKELGLDDRGCALAVTATDFDGDGDQDILLGNDFGPFIRSNRLYRNDVNETGRFTDVTDALGAGQKMFAMGIAVGDYDNDLDLDYYISNLGKNILLEQQENNSFTNRASEHGVENEFAGIGTGNPLAVSWGNLFIDVDNDSDLDLFVSNGYVPAPSFVNNSRLDPDKLFINQGDGHFVEADSTWGIINLSASRGCAKSDIDMDGHMDIFSIVYNKPGFGLNPISCLFKNKHQDENHWIKIKLEGIKANKNGYGSRIYVYTPSQTIMTEHTGASSFCSQNTSIRHFGLGTNTRVDSIRIIWPGGKEQIEKNIELNTLNIITENIPTHTTSADIQPPVVKIVPNPGQGHFKILTDYNIQKIKVFDVSGKMVYSTHDAYINLSEQADGIYVIEVISTNKHHMLKCIKQ